MRLLVAIMRTTTGWKYVWWNDEFISRILYHADNLGLVRRSSTTQVEWTERGAELARKYGKEAA